MKAFQKPWRLILAFIVILSGVLWIRDVQFEIQKKIVWRTTKVLANDLQHYVSRATDFPKSLEVLTKESSESDRYLFPIHDITVTYRKPHPTASPETVVALVTGNRVHGVVTKDLRAFLQDKSAFNYSPPQ